MTHASTSVGARADAPVGPRAATSVHRSLATFIIRWAATPVGLAATMDACAAGAPVGTTVWTAAPAASGPERGAVVVAPSSEVSSVGFDSAALESRPSEDSSSGEGSEAAPPLQSILIIDDAPARVSQKNKPAMTWPAVQSRRRRRPGRPYHPDPRIVIDVVEALGAPQADLQRTARDAGYWPFRRCYEDGLRRDQGLSGKVSIALSISANGQVEQSSATGTTLRDRIVVACVAREAMGISFLPSASKATAEAAVALATGDEPVAVLVPVPGAEGIRGSLREAWPAAGQCYSRALVTEPQLGGHIDLLFRIGFQGEVADVSAGGSRLADSPFGRCVLDVYRGVRLGLHEANRERHFVYPLHFETDPTPSAPEPP